MRGLRGSLRRLRRELRLQRANYHARELQRLCRDLGLSLDPGTLRDGGYLKPSASTSTREHGTRTPGTGTTADCSSTSRPGTLAAVSLDPTLLARVNSYIGLGSTGASKGGADGGRTPHELAG